MRISDWSSDVCPSDLQFPRNRGSRHSVPNPPPLSPSCHPAREAAVLPHLRSVGGETGFSPAIGPYSRPRSNSRRSAHHPREQTEKAGSLHRYNASIPPEARSPEPSDQDRKSTRLNSSH